MGAGMVQTMGATMGSFGVPVSAMAAWAAGSLVAAAWEGLLLAGCVALGLRALRGVTAAARSYLWLGVLLVLALLPVASLMLGRAASASGVAPIHPLRLDARWSVALVAVWALLTVFRLGQVVRSGFYLRRIARRAVPIEVDGAGFGTEGVVVCRSEDVVRPIVVGFVAPRILIPAGLMAKLSDGELEQICLHELEHLRRGDNWTNLLQKIVLALFPLNPALVWVERRVCVERELACDDGVLRRTGARRAYATCLANLAEHSAVARRVSLALGAWERRSELARRVYRILERPGRTMGPVQAGAAMGLLLVGVMAGAFGLAHSPELVSFAPRAGVATASMTDSGEAGLATAVSATEPVSRGLAGVAMVKATMPMADSGVAGPRMAGLGRQRAVRRNVVRRGLAARTPRSESAWVILTGWQEQAAPRGWRLTAADTASYAAVPTRDGWWIIEL